MKKIFENIFHFFNLSTKNKIIILLVPVIMISSGLYIYNSSTYDENGLKKYKHGENYHLVEENLPNVEILECENDEYLIRNKCYNGEIEIKLVINNDEVIDVQIEKIDDEPEYTKRILNTNFIDNLTGLKLNSDVDCVAGATITSKSIVECINAALVRNEKNKITTSTPVLIALDDVNVFSSYKSQDDAKGYLVKGNSYIYSEKNTYKNAVWYKIGQNLWIKYDNSIIEISDDPSVYDVLKKYQSIIRINSSGDKTPIECFETFRDDNKNSGYARTGELYYVFEESTFYNEKSYRIGRDMWIDGNSSIDTVLVNKNVETVINDYILIEGDYVDIDKNYFEKYLRENGITNIKSSEDEEWCSKNIQYVTEIEGLEKELIVNKKDINSVKVEYKYCKLPMYKTLNNVLLGMKENDFINKLKSMGFESFSKEKEMYYDGNEYYPKGTIISFNPTGNVKTSSTINYIVSLGPSNVIESEWLGLTYEEAVSKHNSLIEKNFSLILHTYFVETTAYPENKVYDVRYENGAIAISVAYVGTTAPNEEPWPDLEIGATYRLKQDMYAFTLQYDEDGHTIYCSQEDIEAIPGGVYPGNGETYIREGSIVTIVDMFGGNYEDIGQYEYINVSTNGGEVWIRPYRFDTAFIEKVD